MKEETIKFTIPLISIEEKDLIDKEWENIINKFIRMQNVDKDQRITQMILEKQQSKLDKLSEMISKIKKDLELDSSARYSDIENKIDELYETINQQCVTLAKSEKANIRLKEDNKELKLLSMTQNNREYRSKFLKEYQKEHGENCYPDYDEIYKRYDKLKEENEKLKKRDKTRNVFNEHITNIYKARNNKAIEYINNFNVFERFSFPLMKRWEEEQVKGSIDYEFRDTLKKELLSILQGDDNNGR